MAKHAWGECGGCGFVGDLLVAEGREDGELRDDELLECPLCGAGTVVGKMALYPAEGKTVKERKDKYAKS